MRYMGNLSGASFNKELNKVMGSDFICGTCHHHNGECEEFARAGTCKAYNKYNAAIREYRQKRGRERCE